MDADLLEGIIENEEGSDGIAIRLGPDDWAKGTDESSLPARIVDVRLPSGRGLGKCISEKEKGKGTSIGEGEVGVPVAEEGTDLVKEETDTAVDLPSGPVIKGCNLSDLGKSHKMRKRKCLPKEFWIGMRNSYFMWEEMRKKRQTKKLWRKRSWPTTKFVSDEKYYFPSTFISLHRYTYGNPKLPSFPLNTYLTYPCRNRSCVRMVKGEKLEEDVVSLLSNVGKRDYLVRSNGVKESVVDSVAGKHLVICCFKVPLTNAYLAAEECRAMIAAYSRLRKNNKNFEMVMVAKMTTATLFSDEEAAFWHFFKAFPCLAVPWWDVESRDFLCSSLGLNKGMIDCASVIVDPHGVVSQTNGTCFVSYGSTGFPYTDERLNHICREDSEMMHRLTFTENKFQPLSPPVSLVELLGGTDYLLSRFGGGGTIYASELDSKNYKCLALYLCVDGEFLWEMKRLRDEKEFEVVVVYIPFLWDTTSFVSFFQEEFRKLRLSSWLVAPLIDEEAAHRLWRLCGRRERDEFMFLADGGKAAELDGRTFIEKLGYKRNGYPFTRMSMATTYFGLLRQITIKSLFGLQLCRDRFGTNCFLAPKLGGKKVLLNLDWCENVCSNARSEDITYENQRAYFSTGILYKNLVGHYDEIKKDHPGFELVFVHLHDCEHNELPAHPWLFPEYPAVIRDFLEDKLFKGRLFRDRPDLPTNYPRPTLLAFGEDGIIRSINAESRLEKPSSLFDDTLFQDITDVVHHCYVTYD